MAAKRGRPTSQQPATAWDYRRVIALVQTLASYDVDGILALCLAWDVTPVYYRTDGANIIPLATIRKLAQHALARAGEEGE